MPFFDYAVAPDLLLTLASLVLRVISLVFGFIVAVGPIGMVILVAIPVGLFLRDIHAGPKAFKNHQS